MKASQATIKYVFWALMLLSEVRIVGGHLDIEVTAEGRVVDG